MTWHPDMPEAYRDQVVTGDARELAAAIPDESIDLVLADPVYWQIEDYAWLAFTASRVLKPGGSCVMQTAHEYLPQVMLAVRGHLDYVWQLIEYNAGGNGRLWGKRIFAGYKPWLWYGKGKRQGGGWLRDIQYGGGKDKKSHTWGDSIGFVLKVMVPLCEPEAVVYDPFTGGGTVPAACKMLGRHWVASELDPETAQAARLRIEQAPQPLPEPKPMKQGKLVGWG